MSSERRVLLSLLRLTQDGPVHTHLIRNHARVTKQVVVEVLEKLCDKDLARMQRNIVQVSAGQRVKMAVHAIRLGADPEKICSALKWPEFEGLAVKAFEANNYHVSRNLHFKQGDRRWEMDILGCKEPLIACVDCKHWRHGWRRAAIIKAVESQVERTEALTDQLPKYYGKLSIEGWRNAILVPLVLSLAPSPFKLHNNVPIVSILQLQDFLNELPLHIRSLTHFSKKPIHLDRKLTSYNQ